MGCGRRRKRGAGRSRREPEYIMDARGYDGPQPPPANDVCVVCGDPVFWGTIDGGLVAMDLMCGRIHPHQPEQINTAQANRLRIAEMREHEKKRGGHERDRGAFAVSGYDSVPIWG